MSSNFRLRSRTAINNENPVKNIKENLLTNRKKTALQVLTNTVQSSKKPDGRRLKTTKIVPMQKLETEVTCRSPFQDITHEQNEDLTHFGCISHQEKDILPSSMTCNINMLSDFFNNNTINDENDWFLEDYKNTMIDQVKNTFENFGEPEIKFEFSSLPLMEFPEMSCVI
ncbi:uncharacterized protein LOC126843243 [Adelges cooleyi]|uniref:uncharacterized protein LOC126843243 n=1 Tax=Adelges cooleyi TaxID=133065 RepID=UPI00217FD2FE|nr:uncharacterized protein LOC126843243 [Adelges cooleyi]